MDKPRPTVVIGLLGPTLDSGAQEKRWERWRPTVAVCQHPDLVVSRFELLHPPAYLKLARVLRDDIARVSPETDVRLTPLAMADPWDLECVYAALHDFARAYPFDPEREDYLVHITTGTHVAQIVMFLLTESRHLPARLLQTAPPTRDTRDADSRGAPSTSTSRYDRLASRFAAEARDRAGGAESQASRPAARPSNALIDRVERVAVASRAPILSCGAVGAGEVAARERIWQRRNRGGRW
ncbi:MAG: RNA repair transcriptional activator RtcR family protein [Polyangiales bacterium]